MCVKVGVKLNDVVQVAQTYFPFESMQNSVHHSLKGSRSIAQAKGHHVKFVQPVRGDEGGLWTTRVCQGDLPVPRSQVQRGEKLRTLQGVETVVDAEQRVYIFASDLAQMAVIETQSDGTRTMGDAHRLFEGHVTLRRSMSSTCSSIMRHSPTDTRYGLCH